VDVYEVTTFDGNPERAEAARVSTLEGSPDAIDDAISKVQSETLPLVRELSGNVGIVGLADRKSGRQLAITFWESADALRESEEQANRLREQAAQAGEARIGRVDRYEVAIASELSSVRV
jgi:hypothetical protein